MYKVHAQVTVLTVMWDNRPGHGGSVNSSDHPEHAEPTEMLAALLLSKELGIVRKHDGNGTSDPASEKKSESSRFELPAMEEQSRFRGQRKVISSGFTQRLRGAGRTERCCSLERRRRRRRRRC